MGARLDCNDISDFDVGKTLGTGSFGRVKIANHIQSNTSVALKMLRKRDVMKYNQVIRTPIQHFSFPGVVAETCERTLTQFPWFSL